MSLVHACMISDLRHCLLVCLSPIWEMARLGACVCIVAPSKSHHDFVHVVHECFHPAAGLCKATLRKPAVEKFILKEKVGNDPNGGLVYIGQDERNWHVFDVPPLIQGVPEQLYNVKMGSKFMQLVRQRKPMRVYANPVDGQPNVWEIPARSGVKILMLSATEGETA